MIFRTVPAAYCFLRERKKEHAKNENSHEWEMMTIANEAPRHEGQGQ
jgi:hypothetical protein